MLDKKIIYPIIYLILTGIFISVKGKQNDLFIELSFFINTSISAFYIFKTQNRPYSLEKIFFLFSFFFFGIAPFLQFKENISIWTVRHMPLDAYLETNLLLFICQLIYIICYKWGDSKHYNIYKECRKDNKKWSTPLTNLMLVFSLLVFVIILASKGFNLGTLLLRGGELTQTNIQLSQISMLLLAYFIRPIPLVIFLFYAVSPNNKLKFLITFGLLSLFSISPTSVARLQAAALYIPVILLLFSIFSKKNVFVILFVFGLLVLFPFLNEFRNFSGFDNLSIGLNFDMFYEAHFDAYQNFLMVVDNNIITYGYQLLGSIFFYIPRVIWPSKPVGSGHFIATELDLFFSNIAMPLPAEGYINFGIGGMLIFVMFLAFFSGKIDKKYWNNKGIDSVTHIRYLTMLGMLFFILRGDLLSGIAYTCGLQFCIIIIGKLINLIEKVRIKV